MTFLEAVTFILGATRRAASFTSVAKLCVNLAVKEATQLGAFNCVESKEDITYPASTESITWGSTYLPSAQSIKAIYLLGTDSKPSSKVSIFSYQRVLEDELPKSEFERLLVDSQNRETTTYKAFIRGTTLGLYPEPTEAVSLRVLYNTKLPTLVADADTNILLEHCEMLVLNLALQKCNVYIAEDEQFPISERTIQRSLAAAQQWDNQFANANGIDWPL
jgi:hypothetical protein